MAQQGMALDLTTITDSLTKVVDGYTKYYQDKIKKAVVDARNEIALIKDSSSSLSEVVDELVSPDDLGEAIANASDLCSAFADNPMVKKLQEQFEAITGVAIDNPLEIVKMVMSGGTHPAFKVGAALIQIPVQLTFIGGAVDEIIAHAITLDAILDQAEIDAPGVLAAMDSTTTTTGGIPYDIIKQLKEAQGHLAFPSNGAFFEQARAELDSAIDDLADLQMWKDTAIASSIKMTVTLAINASYALVSKNYTDIQRLLTTVDGYVNTVNTAIIATSNATDQLPRIRKARQEIGKQVHLMQRDVPQAPFYPQYLLALSAVASMLDNSHPVPDPISGTAPVVPGIPSWSSTKVTTMLRLVGKVARFSQQPYNVSVFKSNINDLKTAKADYDTMVTDVNNEVLANWIVLPGVKDTIDSMKSVLDLFGMDAAADALDKGKLDDLMNMTDSTALTTGRVISSLNTIGAVAFDYNFFDLNATIDKQIQKLKKKFDLQKKSADADRKNRIKQIEKLSKSIEKLYNDGESLYNEINGAVTALTAIAGKLI